MTIQQLRYFLALCEDLNYTHTAGRMYLSRQALRLSIAALEEEKKQIEEALCSGTLSVDELTEKSKRLPLLNDELDEKTMRWLELSEIEG